MSFRKRPWLKIVYVLDEVQERNICQINLIVLEAAQISLKGMFQTKDMTQETPSLYLHVWHLSGAQLWNPVYKEWIPRRAERYGPRHTSDQNKELPQTHGQDTRFNLTVSPQSMCKAQITRHISFATALPTVTETGI